MNSSEFYSFKNAFQNTNAMHKNLAIEIEMTLKSILFSEADIKTCIVDVSLCSLRLSVDLHLRMGLNLDACCDGIDCCLLQLKTES